MQLCVYATPSQVSEAAANLIAAQITRKPDSVLGLATGSTPVATYQRLIALHRAGALDFSQATTYNLDEYVGLPEEHRCSYHRFMAEQLFSHVNLRPERCHLPNGNAADLAGGIDLQLLGMGHNGHIGFNEPGPAFLYGCHVVTLSPSTIQANTRFFDSEADVPRQAISLGIGAIMSARQVLLLATGVDKAEAVRRAVEGDVDPQIQASILRLHPNAILLLDRDAASRLS